MNTDLIFNLARDAGFDVYHWNENELEKFAELIITECKIELKPHLRDMISRGKAVDLINERFGLT
jgi:hypothetical protein